MSKITLYMAPDTCARVTIIAMEELGLEFETRVIRFKAGEHRSPEFMSLNPKGKVPLLIHNGEALTENVAILMFLNKRYGQLMPPAEGDVTWARQLADLCFCSSELHPIVARIRVPFFFAEDKCMASVKATGCSTMDAYFQLIEERLKNGSWWYGDEWSVIDAYLYWVFWRVEGAGYDISRFPAFTAHARAMEQRDSVKRAIAREADAEGILKAEGLDFELPEVAIEPQP